MAKESKRVQAKKLERKLKKGTLKKQTRAYSRCERCGRPRSVLRRFGLCRICFKELASQGLIPGVRKSSW